MLSSLKMMPLPMSSRAFSTSCSLFKKDPWLNPSLFVEEPIQEKSKLEGRKTYVPGLRDHEEIKVNFQGLRFFNKRHLREHKRMYFKKFEDRRKLSPYISEHKYGCRGTGIRHERNWEHIPEKVPELIVPKLTGCKLKPYVSYRAKPVEMEEFTSWELFQTVYGRKILSDYETGKLNENGQSLEPSDEEKLTSDEAWTMARQTGSDIFQGGKEPSKEWKVKWQRE